MFTCTHCDSLQHSMARGEGVFPERSNGAESCLPGLSLNFAAHAKKFLVDLPISALFLRCGSRGVRADGTIFWSLSYESAHGPIFQLSSDRYRCATCPATYVSNRLSSTILDCVIGNCVVVSPDPAHAASRELEFEPRPVVSCR